MRRSVFVFLAVWTIAVLAAFNVLQRESPADLASFYAAAKAVQRGLDPYSPQVLSEVTGGQHVWPYLYSPVVAVLVIPLTHLELVPAFHLWTYLSAGSFALSTAILTHRTRVPLVHVIPISVVVALALNLTNVFDLGQINTMVLVPISLAIKMRERKPVLAGASLAVAGLMKSSPFYLVVLFAAERRWRMVAATIVTALALSALTLPIAGLQTWQFFFRMGEQVSRAQSVPGLFSLDTQFSFSFLAVMKRANLAAGISAPLLTLFFTIPIAIAAWRGRKGVVLSALVMMVLAAPLAYTHHVIYVFPGVLLVFFDAAARKRTLYAVLVLVVAFVAGVDFPAHAHAGRNLAAMLALYVLGFLA